MSDMQPPAGYRMLRDGELIPSHVLVYRYGGEWTPPRSPDTVGQVFVGRNWKPMAVPGGPVDYSHTDEGGVV